MQVKWEGVKNVGAYMDTCFLHFPMYISVHTVKQKQNCIRPRKRGKNNLGFVLGILMLLRFCTSFRNRFQIEIRWDVGSCKRNLLNSVKLHNQNVILKQCV